MDSSLIRRLRHSWNRYWFSGGSCVDLAVCRILLVGTQLGVMTLRDVYNLSRFRELARLPHDLFEPLPLFQIFTLSDTFRPSFFEMQVIYYVTIIFGILGLVGLRTNISIFLFTIGNLFQQSFSYSFGDFHHPEALMMFALGSLSLAPSGAALSLDAVLKNESASEGNRGYRREDRWAVVGSQSQFADWPLKLIRWLMALIYFDAAFNKLYHSGLDWMNGYTLRWYLYGHGIHRGSEIAIWIADQHVLTVLLSWVTVLWESTFFLAVLVPMLALLYVPLGIGLHLGMCITEVACFYQFLAVYSVFVPWSRIYKMLNAYLPMARATSVDSQ